MSDTNPVGMAELALLEQRMVEEGFAATIYQYPAYAVMECGWLQPDIILDPTVKAFWALVKDRVTSHTTDQEAAIAVQQAALEAKIDMGIIFRQIVSILPSGSFPQALAYELARRQYISTMALKAHDFALGIGNGDIEQIRRVLAEMQEIVPANAYARLPTAVDAHARFERLIKAGNLAIPFGIAPIDEELGGIERSALLIIAARPSMGKTALALQIATCVALLRKVVHFYSLEMSTEALWARLACPLVGVEWKDVLAGRVSDETLGELSRMGKALAERFGQYLIIDDRPQSTETIWQNVAATRPDLVIVDHIRLCKDYRKGENEDKRLGRITANFHEMAKGFHLGMIALAQLNRNVESRTEKAPTLSDLRDSGQIEENADSVLMIHRPDYYETKFAIHPDKSYSELWVRKFRNGQTNNLIKLGFSGRDEKFTAHTTHNERIVNTYRGDREEREF